MDPKKELARVKSRLAELHAKGASMSDEELDEVDTLLGEKSDLEARIKRIDEADQHLSTIIDGQKGESAPQVGGDLGGAFIKSEAYDNFKKSKAGGSETGSPIYVEAKSIGTMGDWLRARKADTLTTAINHQPPQQAPLIDQVQRRELSLLDLVSKGSVGSRSLEYLQVIAVERGAGLITENTGDDETDTLKPTSDITTQLADGKVFGYADGYTITNQLLRDSKALASYLQNELRFSLDSVIENYLLNGTGQNGQPLGILNTTGVQEQTLGTGADSVLNLVAAVRRAKTKVKKAGGVATAVLVNPEDNEDIDLWRDNEGRFFNGGPFSNGSSTLWAMPRVESELIEKGQAIVADFKQVALLDYTGLSVLAFNQHKDYAQRNLTYVRAELEAMQLIWRPARIVHIGA